MTPPRKHPPDRSPTTHPRRGRLTEPHPTRNDRFPPARGRLGFAGLRRCLGLTPRYRSRFSVRASKNSASAGSKVTRTRAPSGAASSLRVSTISLSPDGPIR